MKWDTSSFSWSLESVLEKPFKYDLRTAEFTSKLCSNGLMPSIHEWQHYHKCNICDPSLRI